MRMSKQALQEGILLAGKIVVRARHEQTKVVFHFSKLKVTAESCCKFFGILYIAESVMKSKDK